MLDNIDSVSVIFFSVKYRPRIVGRNQNDAKTAEVGKTLTSETTAAAARKPLF